MLKFFVGALAAATFLFAPAPAEARCFGTGLGTADFLVCAEAEAGVDGATVAPRVLVSCSFTGVVNTDFPCEYRAIEPGLGSEITVGRTGFVPNPSFPPPCVDAERGTIRSAGGIVGTLYVDGAARDVVIPPFYVGDPAGC